MGHVFHEALELVTSSEEEEELSLEEVWNLHMNFQEGEWEPHRDRILMDPKQENTEDGMTITLTDNFERFYPLIYEGIT